MGERKRERERIEEKDYTRMRREINGFTFFSGFTQVCFRDCSNDDVLQV